MGAIDIGILGIGLVCILIIPILALNLYLKLDMNKRLILSIIRMGIQLTLVGVFLEYIFKFNSAILNMLYLIFMIVVASVSAIKSCKVDLKKFLTPIFMSFLIPNILVLLYFTAVVVRLSNIFEAQYMIPVAGMLLGNSLRGVVVSIDRFYSSISSNEKRYFYKIALGASRTEAILPYVKDAIMASVNPTIASMETIGLVSLPGMMTGQILGGSVPITAIKYQMAIMIAIFVAKYISTLLALYLSSNIAFDEYDVLKRDIVGK